MDWENDFECFSLVFHNYCVIREIEYVLGKHSSKLDAFALTFRYLCIRQGAARQKELKLRFILFALTFRYLCIRQGAARQKELKLRFILFALTFLYLCRRYEN